MSFATVMVNQWRRETVVERRRLAEARAVSEGEIERLLAEQGVISLPAAAQAAAARPAPIRVTGKPISETIIEERR